MTLLEEIPQELLLKIFAFATDLNHPKAREQPSIDWQSPWTIVSKRSSTLQRQSQTTKGVLSRVCRVWHLLTQRSLYEHVFVRSRDALTCLIETLHPLGSGPSTLAYNVKRLDIELGGDGWQTTPSTHIARLLGGLRNLTTLLIIVPRTMEVHLLLESFPPSLERLYWRASHDNDDVVVSALSRIPVERLFQFLEAHPALVTISFPFSFSFSSQTELRAPHPRIREWVVRNSPHLASLYEVGLDGGMLPNIHSRTVTCKWVSRETPLEMLVRRSLHRNLTQPNPTITTLSLVIPIYSSWPPFFLINDFMRIVPACPALQEFNISLFNLTGAFKGPLQLAAFEIRPVPQVKRMGIQRVPEWAIEDSVGTVHHVINLPWKDMFPSLDAVRIHEDIDFEELIDHPTMEFAKGEEWKVRLEDRFGDAIM